MKLLSIVVPSYNSQEYMVQCIESLLPGGGDVEIIVVNDGSHDDTGAIADAYAAKFPGIVKAVHQENGGHGAAVMAGLQNATGTYFKVVDSDDWVDQAAYREVLKTLRAFVEDETGVDLLVSNYVYEKVGKRHKKVMQYNGVLPENRVFTWRDVGRFHKGSYILMHSMIYRTRLLQDCGLKLPRHTFYVDNLYAYLPLASVNSMYYLDVDFYRYYIGREGQSVQEETMIRRIDQQLKVNRLMVEGVDLSKIKELRKRQYMYNYLEIVTSVSTVLLVRSGTEENLEKRRELWRYIYQKNPRLYRKMRHGFLGTVLNLPGRAGRRISVFSYKVSQKVVGFN